MTSKRKSWRFGQEEARCKSLGECEWVKEENGDRENEEGSRVFEGEMRNYGLLPS